MGRKTLELLKQKIICSKGKEEFDLFYKKYFEAIEKDLEALKIINEKNVGIRYFKKCKTIFEYNKYYNAYEKLFESEFNLLKEVLKNE